MVFVSNQGSLDQHRREVLVHSGLLGAGSLDPALVRPLRARPGLARRYLAIEGRRVLADHADWLPLALARSRTKVADAPQWFGVIKPLQIAPVAAPPGARASDEDLRFEIVAGVEDDDEPENEDNDGP